jgi:hypothetical protein
MALHLPDRRLDDAGDADDHADRQVDDVAS